MSKTLQYVIQLIYIYIYIYIFFFIYLYASNNGSYFCEKFNFNILHSIDPPMANHAMYADIKNKSHDTEPAVTTVVPASRKRRHKGNTVSDEMAKYGYWPLMT
jgi:nicotinamide riboside transporter PnuC